MPRPNIALQCARSDIVVVPCTTVENNDPLIAANAFAVCQFGKALGGRNEQVTKIRRDLVKHRLVVARALNAVRLLHVKNKQLVLEVLASEEARHSGEDCNKRWASHAVGGEESAAKSALVDADVEVTAAEEKLPEHWHGLRLAPGGD